MSTPDVVLLLPGFFGFDRFASFYYFADRVSSAIRGHLEGLLGRRVPVIPLATGPADALAHRQRAFLESVARIDRQLGGVRRIHLFGHSTGGLDAELLLRRDRLDGRAWARHQRSIRSRIASVITVAAPHYGTSLARSDVARFLGSLDALGALKPPFDLARALRHPWGDLRLVGALGPALRAVLEAAPQRKLARDQLLGDVGSLGRFLRQIFVQSELMADLVPERVERLRRENPVELEGVPVTCFVTAPLPNPTPSAERHDQPDALFRYLHDLTAREAGVGRPSAEAEASLRRLNGPGVPTVMSPSEVPRAPHSFTARDNDAVVDVARQLLAGAELGAVVHADHADVLGHYDRRDPLDAEQIILEGVFRSGARFGDDEFFDLYRRVSNAIGAAVGRRLVAPDEASAPAPHPIAF